MNENAVYGNIVIDEQIPNIGLLAVVLIKNKGLIKDTFEKAFNAKIETRYDTDLNGVTSLMFLTSPDNVENVQKGFAAIVQKMTDKKDTYVTSIMVQDAAKAVYGNLVPQNDNRVLSNAQKAQATSKTFNQLTKKANNNKNTNNRNFGGKSKNNYKSSGGKGGSAPRSRDRFNSGHDTVSPNELLRDLSNSYQYQFKAKSPIQTELFNTIDANHITFAIGPAGTGKTHIAIAKAVEALVNGDVEKIILSRPIVQNGNELGILPGGIREKLGPYMIPLYDELNEVIQNAELIDQMIEAGIIEIGPIETCRGRTFKNAYVVLDEAQNATLEQTKMFLTRFGPGSRMVLAGDPRQCDLPEPQVSGLGPYSESLKGNAGIGYTPFEDRDIIRHEIISMILRVTENDPKIQSLARKQAKNTPPAPGNN